LSQIPRETQLVSPPAVHEYGPYALYDLDALPEDGKRYELADGWLTELSPSPWHDHGAERLKEILKAALQMSAICVLPPFAAHAAGETVAVGGSRRALATSGPGRASRSFK